MSAATGTPGGLRRLAAIAAALLVVVVVVATLVRVVAEPLRVIAELLLLVVFLAAGWVALTRTGHQTGRCRGVAVAAAVALVAVVIGSGGYAVASLPSGSSGSSSRWNSREYALGSTVGALEKSETPARPCRRPPVGCCS